MIVSGSIPSLYVLLITNNPYPQTSKMHKIDFKTNLSPGVSSPY